MMSWLFLIFLGPSIIELFLLNVGYLLSKWERSRERIFFPKRGMILIPAHNEEKVLPRLLSSLSEIKKHNRIVIIVDNCTDDTKVIAEKEGFETIERIDPSHLGKPAALKWAFEQLQKEESSHFFILDADSIFIPELFQTGALCPDIVQSSYLLERGEDPFSFFSYLKFLATNEVRAKARRALGFSVGILGSGWLIKRETLEEVVLTHALTEDLDLHLQLVIKGKRVVFNEDWKVTAIAPPHFKAFLEQSHRWERGRWIVMKKWLPQLFLSLCRGNFLAFEPLLDLLMPPLSHIILISLAGLVFSPYIPGLTLLMIAIYGLFSLWEARCRVKEIRYLCYIPLFIAKKLWHIREIWRDRLWTKTPRE